jgi:very-short-patch-repair endonuclease
MHRYRAKIDPHRLIAALGARQHGVAGLGQLLEAGLSPEQVRHRARTGRLHRLYRGMYAVGHGTLDARGHWMAAVLACGDGAVLSHRSAAALWGIRSTRAERVEVAVPSLAGRRRRARLLVRRLSHLPASEVTRHDRIPVTTPARTLLDLAAILARPELERVVDESERLGLFALRAVEAVLARSSGRPGTRSLAEMLAHWREPPLTRSELERRFLALCRRHDLPRPLVNQVVGPYEVDFVWPDAGLIVEVDGFQYHGTRTAFETDRARDVELKLMGYEVMRFTHRQITGGQQSVATALQALLASERVEGRTVLHRWPLGRSGPGRLRRLRNERDSGRRSVAVQPGGALQGRRSLQRQDARRRRPARASPPLHQRSLADRDNSEGRSLLRGHDDCEHGAVRGAAQEP